MIDTVHLNWSEISLTIPAAQPDLTIRVIGIVPDQVITKNLELKAPIRDSEVVTDVEQDLLKLAVIERHRGTGNVGLGMVQGLGLKRGALAGSVGHDAHNVTVAGCDDASMLTAIRAVADLGGGLVVADGDQVLESVPLPIAGLMSDQPVEEVRKQMDSLTESARSLGTSLHDPFMTLGFLALEVIPSLKLTDQGLVDVDKFDFVPLFVER